MTAVLVLLAAFLTSRAHAVTIGDLYETSQPVVASQDAAFEEALKRVLVRVSGQRDAAARAGAGLATPRKYVQRFGVTADNVLQVGFDSVAVDKLLSESGLPIWGRERPATLIVLDGDAAAGATRWVSAEAPASEREAIERAAYERGLPLVWALVASGDGLVIGADPGEQRDALLQVAQRYGANAVLVGRVRGGSAVWTLLSAEGAAQVAGGLVDGVHLAADAFARLFSASGSSLSDVVVEVTGVRDLDAYASALNYLESMTLVRNVAVEQIAGDALRFRVVVRGDADTLRRAIALDNRLLPHAPPAAGSAAPVDRLSFRYNR